MQRKKRLYLKQPMKTKEMIQQQRVEPFFPTAALLLSRKRFIGATSRDHLMIYRSSKNNCGYIRLLFVIEKGKFRWYFEGHFESPQSSAYCGGPQHKRASLGADVCLWTRALDRQADDQQH